MQVHNHLTNLKLTLLLNS